MALNMSAILNLNGNFIAQMKAAADASKQMQSKVNSFATDAKLAFGAVGIAAAGYLVSAVNSAAKAQTSTVQLQGLLKNQGIAFKNTAGDINTFTGGMTKMSTYSAGEAKSALINLTEKGMSYSNSLKSQTALANLAAGTNTDLTSSSTLLAQAYNGRYTQLEKLGIVTKAQVKSGITYTQVLDDINKRFNGSAQAQMNTYAGQVKIINNNMASMKTAIGTALLPVLTTLMKTVNATLEPLINLVKTHAKLAAGILTATAAIGTLVGGLAVFQKIGGMLGPTVGGIAQQLGKMPIPIILIIATIALLTEAFTKNWGGIRTKTEAFINFMKPIITNGIGAIVAWVKVNLPIMEADFKKVLDNILKLVNTYIMPIVRFVISQVGQIVNWVKANLPLIESTIKIVLDTIKSIITTVLNVIEGFWTAHGAMIMGLVKLAWSNIQIVISTAIKVVEDVLKAVMQIINGNWSGAWTSLCDAVKTIFGGVGKIIQNVITGIGLMFKDLATTAEKWGSDFVDGLVKGITGGVGKIGSAVKGIASSIASSLHFSKPDTGVLRDYEKWMPDMLSGMGKSLTVNTKLITDPIKTVALGIKTNMQGGIAGTTATANSTSKDTSKTSKAPFIIQMYGATIRKDADIDDLATALANKLLKVDQGTV